MSSPSAQDRLEDTLTDGVFSALRYLPRDVLARWLRSVLPPSLCRYATDAAVEAAVFDFWPTMPGGSEPDVAITVGSLLVIVEAKYQSGFGQGWGRHQLAVEWEHGRRLAQRRGFDGPVVIAVTSDLVEPAAIAEARTGIADDSLLSAGLSAQEAVVWCPWQAIAKAIEHVDRFAWSVGEHAVSDDVFDLMKRRGVRHLFEGFNLADWWILAAAADAATERVYPAVAEFGKELRAQGAERGLIWGGTDSGVVWYESKQPANTHRWHRHYVQLPMMHKGFGRRIKNRCALYVLFSFNDPAIRAGWWFGPSSTGALSGHSAGIVGWLHGLEPEFNIIDAHGWQRPPVPVDRSLVTAAWLRDRLNDNARFRVERSWRPEAVTTTAPVIDLLSGLADSLITHGAVLNGLEADGTLDRTMTALATPILPGEPEDEDEVSSEA